MNRSDSCCCCRRSHMKENSPSEFLLFGVSFFGKGDFPECDSVSGHLWGGFSGLVFGSETGSGSRTLDNSSLCPLILYQPPSSTAGRQSTASHPSRVLECQLSPHNCPYVRGLTQASDLMLLYNGLLVLYSVLGVDTCSLGLLIIF